MDYKNINDYELVYRVRENDDEAFSIILKKYEPIIINLANKYFPLVKKFGIEISDIIQEGRIAVVKALNSFNNENTTIFYTYVRLCIERHLVSYLRFLSSKKNSVLSYSLGDDNLETFADVRYEPINYLCRKCDYEIFLDFKNSLDFLDSNIVELKYNGFSYKEISILLDLTLSCVSSRLFRIKRKMLKRKTN